MIKRVIAGALSAVMCTSAASVGASAHGLSGVLSTPSVAAAADEPVSTAAVTTSETTAATTTSATTTSATTKSAATTTAAASEPTLTVELGESITASVSEGGTVIISGSGEMNSFKSSPFENLKIKRVIIGDGISSIGSAVFRGCDELAAFGTADVPDGVSELPDSIKTVGSSAFEGCKAIKELRLGSGAEKLGSYAFANCTGLTSLTVPASVTTMERCVFSGCTEFTELTLPYEATDASCATADGDVSPDNSVADLFYDEHWNWDNPSFDSSAYKLTKITVTGGEKVPQYAFANMKCLKEVDLSAAKTVLIDSHAFYRCSSLTDVRLPESLTALGDYSFSETPITALPDNGHIISLGNGVFAGCQSLEVTTFPASYENIGTHTFSGCTGIKTFAVPENVKTLGRMSFMGCTELTELTLTYAATNSSCTYENGDTPPDNSVTDLFYDEHWNWENTGFDSMPYKLTKITVVGGEKIPQYAFSNMRTLREVELSGADIRTIDPYAFSGCVGLTSAEIPETVAEIKPNAFAVTNADVFVYGKETVLADKSLTDGYAGTIFGYNESSAKTYADENEYSFSPLDGKGVISPSFVSMAVGDTHRIRTGAAGVTFSTSAPEIASVDKNGTVTAISAGRAVIEALTADGTSYTVDIEVRPRVSLCTLGDVNDDGKIDAKDASAILSYYALASTAEGDIPTLEEYLAPEEQAD